MGAVQGGPGEQVAWLQHEEEERREAERKAREALAAQIEGGGEEGSKTGETAES